MEGATQKGRVLIVDDAVFMRQQLREIFEGGGYVVVAEGEDGVECLELFDAHEPDLVTLDLVMPRMDGIQALAALKDRHPEARVIVCSSISDEPSILRAISLGARDYLLKPVNSVKVLAAADKALMGRSAEPGKEAGGAPEPEDGG